jgi:cell division inhibitor SepF
MAGAMRKMGVYLGLVEDDEPIAEEAEDRYQSDYRRDTYRSESDRGYGGDASYGDYEYNRGDYSSGDYGDTPEPATATAARRDIGSSRPSTSTISYQPAHTSTQVSAQSSVAAVSHPTPWSEGRVSSETDRAKEHAAAMSRITTVHPRTYNEARTIGEQFRSGTPVIMNLTEMDDSDAKRLVDFAAGLTFGLRGSIDRVTNRVFLLSPHNVDVTAEDKARIAEGGFFNQS